MEKNKGSLRLGHFPWRPNFSSPRASPPSAVPSPLLGPRTWCHRLVGPTGQLSSARAQPSSLVPLQFGPTRRPDTRAWVASLQTWPPRQPLSLLPLARPSLLHRHVGPLCRTRHPPCGRLAAEPRAPSIPPEISRTPGQVLPWISDSVNGRAFWTLTSPFK